MAKRGSSSYEKAVMAKKVRLQREADMAGKRLSVDQMKKLFTELKESFDEEKDREFLERIDSLEDQYWSGALTQTDIRDELGEFADYTDGQVEIPEGTETELDVEPGEPGEPDPDEAAAKAAADKKQEESDDDLRRAYPSMADK